MDLPRGKRKLGAKKNKKVILIPVPWFPAAAVTQFISSAQYDSTFHLLKDAEKLHWTCQEHHTERLPAVWWAGAVPAMEGRQFILEPVPPEDIIWLILSVLFLRLFTGSATYLKSVGL